MAARLFLMWAAAACLCGCDKREREQDRDAEALIARAHDPWVEVDEFWNQACSPGHVKRSIGFNYSLGLFVFWELSDIPPFTSKPQCWGSFSKAEGRVKLRLPFGLEHRMRLETHDGVECLVPYGMTVEEAQTNGWLLIRRKGASFDRPFDIERDEVTVFDRP